jgi:hypothetical protein
MDSVRLAQKRKRPSARRHAAGFQLKISMNELLIFIFKPVPPVGKNTPMDIGAKSGLRMSPEIFGLRKVKFESPNVEFIKIWAPGTPLICDCVPQN